MTKIDESLPRTKRAFAFQMARDIMSECRELSLDSTFTKQIHTTVEVVEFARDLCAPFALIEVMPGKGTTLDRPGSWELKITVAA